MPIDKTKGWEKEFDEKFNVFEDGQAFWSCYLEGDHCGTNPVVIKHFIQTLLDEKDNQLKEIVEEIIGEKLDIEKEIGMKLDLSFDEQRGYNTKRQEIITILKNKGLTN